jgi:hypothetical protein
MFTSTYSGNLHLVKRGLYAFLFFTFWLCSHRLQSQSVSAQVSSRQVQVGVPFDYAIVVNTTPNTYSPPSFRDFDVVSGPNQSSSMQWVNGQTSVQMTISWSLIAKKEGKFTIGQAVVTVGNQRFETSAITIEALKGAASSQQQAEETKYSNPISGGDLFIRTSVSKNRCFAGEQVSIVQKVYCRHQIIGFQKFSQPTYDGFYSQAQESTSKGQLGVENIDGVNYYSYELFRTVAIANKIGKITLTPIEGDVVVRRQAHAKPKNIFEQFFGAPSYEDIPVPAKSKPMNVEVMPLPEQGKPESFSGAVGDFSYKVVASRTELKANDAFNLKFTITGRGNLKLLNAPPIKLPDGFESYEPKLTENATSKTFDFLVIPRNEGTFLLEGLDFSYFNPEQKKYFTHHAGEIKIHVLPPDPGSAGARVYMPQSQVKETENDIRYIRKGDFALTRTETEFFDSGLHLGLIALPIAGLALGLTARRRYLKTHSDPVMLRRRKAAHMARKRLGVAEKQIAQKKKDEFYAEVLTAMNNYLGHKLGIPASDLSRSAIESALAEKNTSADLRIKLLSLLDNCEYARYAPGAVSGDLKSAFEDAVSLIASLEDDLNRKG